MHLFYKHANPNGGVGQQFSGRYYVERVLHQIGSDGSYVQKFTLRRNATGLTGRENFKSDDGVALSAS